MSAVSRAAACRCLRGPIQKDVRSHLLDLAGCQPFYATCTPLSAVVPLICIREPHAEHHGTAEQVRQDKTTKHAQRCCQLPRPAYRHESDLLQPRTMKDVGVAGTQPLCTDTLRKVVLWVGRVCTELPPFPQSSVVCTQPDARLVVMGLEHGSCDGS